MTDNIQPIYINTIVFHYNSEILNERYNIYSLSVSEDVPVDERYIKNNAAILDIDYKNEIQAISYTNRNKLYIMTVKNDEIETGLENIIYSLHNENKYILKREQWENLKDYEVNRLLFNALKNYNSKSLRFSNTSGKLLYYIKNKDEEQKIAIEIYLSKEMKLYLNVKTLTSKIADNFHAIEYKKGKNWNSYPHYTVKDDQILRTYDNNIPDKDVYIIRQKRNTKKSEIVFYDARYGIQNLEGTKSKVILELLKTFNDKYKGFASIAFEKKDSRRLLLGNRFNKLADKTIQTAIETIREVNILDMVKNDNSQKVSSTLIEYFMQKGIGVYLDNRLKHDIPNICIIHNKDYYKKQKEKDIYEIYKENIVQHITIEECKKDKINSILDTTLLNLMIKYELYNNRLIFEPWKQYNFDKEWEFIYQNKDELDIDHYFSMVIQPSGSFNIKELDELEIMDNDAVYLMESKETELIIITDKKEIIKINNYNEFTILPMEKLEYILKEVEKYNKEHKKHIGIKGHKPIFNDIDNVETIEDPAEYLLSAVTEMGYWKNTDTDYSYYVANESSYGPQARSATSVHIRRLISEDKINENTVFLIMNMMQNMFVRNKNLTVLPFPAKYLREYIAKIQ